MKVIRETPEVLETSAAVLPATRPTINTAVVFPEEPESPKWSGDDYDKAFYGEFQRQNTVASVLNRARASFNADTGAIESDDPTWNVYRYARENWDEERLGRLEPLLRTGHFDNAFSPEEMEARALAYEKDIELKEMAEKSPYGALVGGVVGSLVDPINLIPGVGWARGATRVGRVGLLAADALASTALSELVLQSTQHNREAQETLLNIGVSGVIGAGIGVFARAFDPAHPLHPSHPDNPLKPENFDRSSYAVRPLHDSLEGEEVYNHRSLSSAAVDETPVEPLSRLGDRVPFSKYLPKFTRATPVGRALYRSSDAARRVYLGLVDLGGILTNLDARGVSSGPNAESLKTFYRHYARDVYRVDAQVYREVNEALGSSAIATRVGFGSVPAEDIRGIARRMLVETWTPSDRAQLAASYGEQGASIIEGGARKLAEKVHQTNEFFEQELIRIGALQDKEKLATLSKEYDRLKREVRKAKAAAKGEEAPAGADELARLVESRDMARAAYYAERRKAAPLGRKYGHAQLYDRAAIMDRREEFGDFLRSVLLERPMDDWLEDALSPRGLDLDDFDRLGKEVVELEDGRTLSVEEGSKLRREIIREWSGDEQQFRLGAAERRRTEAERAYKQAKADYEFATGQARKGAAINLEQSKAALDEAKRAVKSASSKAAWIEKQTPMDALIDEITDAIVTGRELPRSIMDRVAMETGRVKKRVLHLTPEQRRAGEDAGFLVTDLPDILENQYHQLSGYLGFHEALGIVPGGRFSSWDDVLKHVQDDYAQLIAKTTDPKKKAKLREEMQGTLNDLTLLKDRLLGTEDIGFKRGDLIPWLSAKVRQANFVRMGDTFLVASMTDMAATRLHGGPIGKLIRKHGLKAAQTMRRAYTDDPDLFRGMLLAQETVGHLGRVADLYDISDADAFMGIGAKGSTRYKVTRAVDKAGHMGSEIVTRVSGLRVWNKSWRMMVGFSTALDVRKAALTYETLSEKQRAIMASLGIGRAEADRLRKFFTKYPGKDELDFRLEDWMSEPGGRDAARDLMMAVNRNMVRANFEPGIGDRPRIMSNSLMQILMQFQTFAFTFTNRFIIPASQRLATYRDVDALAALGVLAWSSLMVVTMKDIMRGDDPAERYQEGKWAQTMFDVVDRSGMMGYMSPYVDSLLKFGGTQKVEEAIFGEAIINPSTRFVQNNWANSLLGPSTSLWTTTTGALSAAGRGDTAKAAEKASRLVPLGGLYRTFYNVALAEE